MPSIWHDTVNELFKRRPEFGAEILRDLMGVEIPPGHGAVLGPTVFNTRVSKDLAADIVIICDSGSEAKHGIIVEAQQDRLDKKRAQLPRYAAALWLERECPVNVLVICPDEATAAWYAQPIPTTVPGYTFQPRALYPSRVPAFTNPEEAAAHPSMAALSVAFHGLRPRVADAFIEAMTILGAERGLQYYEFGHRMSPKAIRDLLEELVTTADHWIVSSSWGKEHFGRGVAEGRLEDARESVLEVLQARSLEPTREEHNLISQSSDLAQLKTWLRMAATVARVSDLFA